MRWLWCPQCDKRGMVYIDEMNKQPLPICSVCGSMLFPSRFGG